MKFTIEKNKPILTRWSGLNNDLTETMRDLQPGDSFFVLFNSTRTRISVTYAFQNAKKKFKDRYFKSALDTIDPGAKPGLRIGRVKPPKQPTYGFLPNTPQ